MLTHITAHIKARGEFLSYADALHVYKTLCGVRLIHRQVSLREFQFDLEAFSYPYLEAWVQETNEKITAVVGNALANDDFQPMALEEADLKYSLLVHDVFSVIKHYLAIFRDLQWEDQYQLARAKTSFMRSISACCIRYSYDITEMTMHDLTDVGSDDASAPGWFAEAKSLVAHKLRLQKPGAGGVCDAQPDAVEFTPRTCIGLNNLGAMAEQLSRLEDVLHPEEVLATVLAHDPTARTAYTSHVFSIRVVRGEGIRSAADSASVRPYVTLTDTEARRTFAKTRPLAGDVPHWDEDFEVSLPANSSMTVSVTVWEERSGAHGLCGRALLQLEPRKFKHDGLPQEIYLDLDPTGRVLVEVAVESEREDAVFAMGRAHRALRRAQQRIIKLVVARFSKCIARSFSRQTLRAVCGPLGNVRPTQEQLDEAMMPLCDFLNVNLLVFAACLTTDLLLLVMLEAWSVVVASADALLLPPLWSSKAVGLMSSGAPIANRSRNSWHSGAGWQSAVSSAVANVTSSISGLAVGRALSINEVETVIGWLNYLCVDFFHNDGNGPPVLHLKNVQYQSLLLVPVYYDTDVSVLVQEVERLAPAFLQTLRDKHNLVVAGAGPSKLRLRAGSIARQLTIRANATTKAREQAAREVHALQTDPLAAQTAAENVILRLLLLRDKRTFVGRRLEQRERLAHTIATERLAKAVAEATVLG